VLTRRTTLGCPSSSQAAKSAVPRLARVAATAAWATWAAIFPRPISRSVLTTSASFTATVATISVADEDLGGMLAQLGNGGDPQQPHRPLELLGQQIQGLVHARLAGGHQAVQVGAADRHRVGPERGGDGDVGAVPDAGVDQHRQIRADRLADPGQQVDGAMARSSWRPPWLDSCRPSTPASTARRASAAPSGPVMTSLPGHCSRSAAMSSQSMPGSKRLPVWAIVTGWRRVRLARPAAGLRSMRTQ